MDESLNPADPSELDTALRLLSLTDRDRLAVLIRLIRDAPDDVRAQTRRRLRDLVGSPPRSYDECTHALDAIIESAARQSKRPLASRAGSH